MAIALHNETFEWNASDGVRLWGQVWQSGSTLELNGTLHGAVCLVHGFGEHSGRYAHVAAALAAAGYALLACDLRGHGRSGGRRGDWPSYAVVLDDVGRLLAEAKRRFSGLPCFLYGHSMGGNLVLNYVLRRRPLLAGVVATGPWLRLAFDLPAGTLALAKTVRHLWPSLTLSAAVDANGLSRDPDVGRAYRADPLVHGRQSVRVFSDITAGGEYALAHAAEFSLPLLLMHGAADPITSPAATQEFAAHLPADCTLALWPGGYHELHNDLEWEQVLGTLCAWLDAHLSHEQPVGEGKETRV